MFIAVGKKNLSEDDADQLGLKRKRNTDHDVNYVNNFTIFK